MKFKDISPKALAAWNPTLRASVSAEDSAHTITLTGFVGDEWVYDDYARPITLARVDAALRSIGDNRATVYINSPGGSMFEGIAIYNRLREHKAGVTVKVIGIAASAASVISMAGDKREIAKSAFLMIHNCWSLIAGNRHKLLQAAEQFEEFDKSMAGIYADATGIEFARAVELMDKESYLSGSTAVELGFSTSLMSSDEIETDTSSSAVAANALKQLDVALSKGGMPRSERRKLLNDLKSSFEHQVEVGNDKPSAVVESKPSAALDAATFNASAKLAKELKEMVKL